MKKWKKGLIAKLPKSEIFSGVLNLAWTLLPVDNKVIGTVINHTVQNGEDI